MLRRELPGRPVRRRWPSSSSAAASPFGARSGLPSCTWYAPGARARDQQLQVMVRLALDAAGRPAPSRRCPWPCLSLVPDPDCRQALQHQVSSRYRSAARRHWSQQGIAMATTSAGTGQAPKGKGSAGHLRAGSGPAFCSTWYATGISSCRGWPARPGRRRPSRAIEALPMAPSLPGTGSGLPAGPAAAGELAVPAS